CQLAVSLVFSPLSLHDALPISAVCEAEIDVFDLLVLDQLEDVFRCTRHCSISTGDGLRIRTPTALLGEWHHHLSSRGNHVWRERSEEHTSELQSRENLVCRLLL